MNRLEGHRGGLVMGGKRSAGSRWRNLLVTAAVGLTPVAALAWAGCSDDDENTATLNVDPGGTFGAEVIVTVTGLGTVTSTTPGIDCPSTCTTKYTFPSSSAPGASAGGIKLKATPREGAKFLGWTFETSPGGTAGRYAECNPLVRPATQPSAGANDVEITLPFGEVDGTPPAGKEATCAATKKVPPLYKLIAKFDEKSPDAEAPGDLIVYKTPPGTVAQGGRLGFLGSRLWFEFKVGTASGLAYGDAPTIDEDMERSPTVQPLNVFTASDFSEYGIVWQTASGAVSWIQPGDSFETTRTVSPGTCIALKVDAEGYVWCRTSTLVLRWSAGDTVGTPETVYDSFPTGKDIEVDAFDNQLFYTTSSEIRFSPTDPLGSDAGTGQLVVSGQASPQRIVATFSSLFWSTTSGVFASSRSAGSVAYSTLVPSGQYVLSLDTNGSEVWAASTTAIYRVSYSPSSAPEAFRSGLTGIGGVAADSTYVYWTQSDGTLRRAPKNASL